MPTIRLLVPEAVRIWPRGESAVSRSSVYPAVWIARSSSLHQGDTQIQRGRSARLDRKSTRLNSSHRCISYAVFCLKKKTKYAEGGSIHVLPAEIKPNSYRRVQ